MLFIIITMLFYGLLCCFVMVQRCFIDWHIVLCLIMLFVDSIIFTQHITPQQNTAKHNTIQQKVIQHNTKSNKKKQEKKKQKKKKQEKKNKTKQKH